MIYITRRERFNAAHRLFRHDFTDEQNLEVFGKCSNPNWHGHNYELFVTVKGNIDDNTGFLVNLKSLSKIIKQFIICKLDHKNINLEVDFMEGKLDMVVDPLINEYQAELLASMSSEQTI